ncbi:hypothetical protein [Hyphococcus sp.]|uniref:hypothetical protein n=1 Tax=Hyphococcus sp. TaxID=2038636 RepID=UPI003D0A3B12
MEKTILTTDSNAGHSGAAVSDAARPRAVKRAGEALFFTGVILLSSLAVVAIAIAAPFVLAASAIAGFLTRKEGDRGWRPVSA